MRTVFRSCVSVVVAAACATTSSTVPPPAVEPPTVEARGELISATARRCERGDCSREVTVGSTVMHLTYRAGDVDPDDLREGKATGKEQVEDFMNWAFSLTPIGDVYSRIGMGTIRLLTPDPSMVWRCRMVWLDGVEKTGWLEEETYRQQEGLDCTGYALPDSVAQWHLRRGISVKGAEVGRLARQSGRMKARNDLDALPIVLRPAQGDTTERARYTARLERRISGHSGAGESVFAVKRGDGVRIATFTFANKGPSTVELTSDASATEAALVRTVIGLLKVPYRNTH